MILNKNTIYSALIAAASGLAAALVFVLASRGTLGPLVLAYFAPVPLMLAALVYGLRTGVASALIGVAAISAFNLVIGLFFVVGVAGPALALSAIALYDAGGSRGIARAPTDVVISAAGAAIVSTIIGVLAALSMVGGYEAGYDAMVKLAEPAVAELAKGVTLPGQVTVEDIARKLVSATPLVMSASATGMFLTNFWIAARVARLSSDTDRPWPSLADTLSLPPLLAAVFAGGAVLSFVDGPLGLIGGVVAAALGVAFALQGLAVAHVLTRGSSMRGGLIAGLYALIVVAPPWPLIALAAAGLSDTLFQLRARAETRAPP